MLREHVNDRPLRSITVVDRRAAGDDNLSTTTGAAARSGDPSAAR